MKLDPELKFKWTSALRSGDFKQGHSCLENEEGQFCCLGVLCKIVELPTFTTKEDDEIGEYHSTEEWIPETDKIPSFLVGDTTLAQELAEMNDSGESFESIANYIEQKL